MHADKRQQRDESKQNKQQMHSVLQLVTHDVCNERSGAEHAPEHRHDRKHGSQPAVAVELARLGDELAGFFGEFCRFRSLAVDAGNFGAQVELAAPVGWYIRHQCLSSMARILARVASIRSFDALMPFTSSVTRSSMAVRPA